MNCKQFMIFTTVIFVTVFNVHCGRWRTVLKGYHVYHAGMEKYGIYIVKK